MRTLIFTTLISKELDLKQMFLIVMSIFAFSLSMPTFAISQQQLAAFQKLPKSQQMALAKKMGVDLNSANNSIKNTNETLTDYSSQYSDTDQTLLSQEELIEKQYKPESTELKVFGVDLFNNANMNNFKESSSSSPVDHQLVPGDQLVISLIGKDNENYELIIDQSGRLFIPGLSPVSVLGLTLLEVKEVLKMKVKKEKIGVDIYVSIGNLQPIRVFVAGEVEKPGSYIVPPLSTITTAILYSGGITDISSLRNIQLKRNNSLFSTFDLYDLLLSGNNINNSTLKNGDVLFVPSISKQVTLKGAVKRPAKYELLPTDNLNNVLKYAGGLAANAYTETVRIDSFGQLDSKIIKDINIIESGNTSLKDGDIVTVHSKGQNFSNSITLIGAVSRPGLYQWHEGLKVSEFFPVNSNALLEIADKNYALLMRKNNKTDLTSIFQIEPNFEYLINNDIELKPNDKIVVFSRFETVEAESKTMSSYAFTKQKYNELQKQLSWGKYKKQAFENFVDDTKFEGGVIDKKIAAERFSVTVEHPIQLYKLKGEIQEVELSLFSRSKLLPVILSELEKQAAMGKPAQIVEISGLVKYPGLYPITMDSKVTDVIKAAGGLLEGAYMEQAEITRIFSNENIGVNNLRFSLSSALDNDPEHNLSLVGRDYVNIFKTPNWHNNQTVTLNGEVQLPGKYTIQRGESLKSLIVRAGGFTEFADKNAAVFTRSSLKAKEKKQIADMAASLKKDLITNNLNSKNNFGGATGSNEIDKLIDKLSDTDAVGRLVIDFNKIMDESIVVSLESKDELYIPSKRQSVNVIGEVFVATSHIYDSDLDIQDYINLSGGMKDKAATSKVFIIRASGKVEVPDKSSWFSVQNNTKSLQAGDTIVVPLDSEYTDNLTLWSQATQIVYQLAVAVAAIGSL